MVVSSLGISESNRLTILSYDNSGEIKFDVDIEMEQGYWNTSGSRLWTKIRDYMHDELVATYKDMRANGVTYENIMRYMYDEQIAVIPQSYFNKDFDIKYAPYADTYLGKAHGDGLQHMKRWLKKRFIFCDTLFDYAPSYENDVLTIRANTLDQMNLTIETYTPLYQHVSFYNGNMEKIKVKPGEPITFSGYAQTATDQEVLIYGGSNIKKISGISSCNPNSMLIGGATRLTELDISNCPILTIVNSNKANFSPHTYLNKLNMSNCPQLGGNLNVSNSPLLQEIDARGSAITGLLMPPSLRNLTTLKLPNTLSSLTLNDVNLLHTLELDEGSNLQSISLTNCNNLTNTVNFDITNASTVKLDNSYHTEELYMSEVTDLTLKNMHSLQRVIFTPNSEYSEFDINNVINGKSYKVTTFNNPKMTDFITTAPHRISYKNGEYGDITPNTVFTANTLDLSDTQFQNVKFLCTTDIYNLKVPTTMKNFYCDSAMDIDTDIIEDASYEVIHEELIEPYTTNYEGEVKKVSLNLKECIFPLGVWDYPDHTYDGSTGNLTVHAGYNISDFIETVPGSTLELYNVIGTNSRIYIAQYDKNKNYLKGNDLAFSNGAPETSMTWVLNSETHYIRISPQKSITGFTIKGNLGIMMTPNIIPSSANGSLIFNMYSNNTTQPTSTSPYMWDLTGLKLEDFYTYGMNNWVKQDESGNITMPQRLPGYSVRLVNADITPDEYPTMLYPKLIDTTLPITGKLDYTKYNGSSLAWAYAYTTGDVNINPLDGRSQGNITNDYNKLYGTDFNDVVEVWVYASADFSNKSTNEAITKAYIELTNDNYKTRIDEVLQWYPNCTDLYFFEDGSVTSLEQMFSGNNLICRTQIISITFIEGYFDKLTNIRNAFVCINMTNINNLPKNITQFPSAFVNCYALNQQFDLSDYNITTNGLQLTFQNCSSLTHTPILPSNYVGSMNNCFQNCSSLTTAPNIPNGVDNMQSCFDGCTSLTTVPNIPSSCEYYDKTFYNCTKLSSVPIDGWKGYFYRTFYNCISLNQQINITSATLLEAVFEGCSSLTIPPILPSNYKATMVNSFNGCTSLTEAPIIPDGVTYMNSCFRGCTSLTQAPTIPNSVTNMSSCFNSCTSLTQAPTIPNGVTNMSYIFYGCSSLTQAPVIPSSVKEANYCFAYCTSLTTGSNIQSTSLKMTCFYENCSNLQTATIPFSAITEYQDMLKGCSKLTDITWTGERTSNFNFSYIGKNDISQKDIQELVPEHLADLTSQGTTATLTLGDYASYLSIGEILSAQAKGWTIEGNFSGDYAIVNASTDLSAVEVNSDITTVIVELTNDNYKTRMNEVYTKYPSMTDVLFIEDGTVTTLADMFNNSNNNTCRSKIKKIEFMEGYFQNLTNLSYSFYQCSSLTDIINIPSSVTNMYRAFYYCGKLVNVSDFPDGVTNVNYTFYYCESLVTSPKLGKTTKELDYTFYSCENLTSIPEFPPSATKLTGTFSGCSKLKNIPKIPDTVTDMSNCFYNCTALTEAPALPANIQMLSSTFYGCSAMTKFPSIIPKTVINSSNCFYSCKKMVTPPEFEHTDGSNLYPGRMFHNCSSMTTAPRLPEGLTNIQGMFMGCSKLEVPPTIPNSVTNIQEIFNNCTSLTQNPNVPTGVTNLKYAFANSSITAITIPLANLTTYDYAISKCPNLTDVTWVGELTKTFNVKNLYYKSATDNTTPTGIDIQELVPEHLGTVTGQTLTLGDYISHLSEDEISQAVAKGWILQ